MLPFLIIAAVLSALTICPGWSGTNNSEPLSLTRYIEPALTLPPCAFSPVTISSSIIKNSEAITNNNKKFTLNICVNYGGRQEIVKAAKEIAIKSSSGEIKTSDIDEQLFNSELLTNGSKDPELLIRTSGEKRISNFLLWQLAYSEIYITDVLWPDFTEIEFLKAIIDYQSRNRRFGGIESLSNESFEDSYYSSLSKND